MQNHTNGRSIHALDLLVLSQNGHIYLWWYHIYRAHVENQEQRFETPDGTVPLEKRDKPSDEGSETRAYGLVQVNKNPSVLHILLLNRYNPCCKGVRSRGIQPRRTHPPTGPMNWPPRLRPTRLLADLWSGILSSTRNGYINESSRQLPKSQPFCQIMAVSTSLET